MIKIAAAAAVAASIVFAPAAYADDDAYLDELSGQGFQVMWQSRPFLLAAGNGMCNDLRNGETPSRSPRTPTIRTRHQPICWLWRDRRNGTYAPRFTIQ